MEREKHELAKSDRAVTEMKKIALQPNKALRKKMIKVLRADMANVNFTINSDLEELVLDDQFIEGMMPGLNFYGKSDEDVRGQFAQIEFFSKPGSDIQEGFKSFNEQLLKRKKLEAQQAKAKAGAFTDIRDFISRVHKSDVTVVNQFNKLADIASSPERRKTAFAGDTAKVIISKIFDPEGVVRKGEIDRLAGLSAGWLAEAKLAVQNIIKGQELDENQWHQIMTITQIAAQNSQESLARGLESQRPVFEAQGVEPEALARLVPTARGFDFRAQFGKPAVGAKRFASRAAALKEARDRLAKATSEADRRALEGMITRLEARPEPKGSPGLVVESIAEKER
jgi:hypothetical protein